MSTFADFKFAEAIAENLARHGFETPTPIQAEAIPLVMQGHDVVGLAATGTGKTAAFVLPMLHKLSTGAGRCVRALIIAPTRELAEQINGVVHQLGRGTHLHTASIYGGVSYRPQFDAIRRGAEIVVACPGRLLDHLEQGSIRLDRVEMLVLDEADQMFDMGFLPAIKNIIRRVPANRQTLLFSATMPPEIRRLTTDILRNPKEIKLASTTPVATVSHALFPCKQENKADLVIELLRRTDTGPVLIFARTRHRTKKLADTLLRAGFKVASIEGGLTQNRRKRAMDGFRSGEYQILVATDVAARGIDVSGISHVINYDMPDTIEAYTHRIGRTGRAAKTGDAYTLVTREDNDMVRQIERALKAEIERKFLDGFAPAERDNRPPSTRAKFAPDRNAGPGRTPFRERAAPQRDDNFKPFTGHKPKTEKPAAPTAAPAPESIASTESTRSTPEAPAAEKIQHVAAPAPAKHAAETPRAPRPESARPRDERPRDERPRDFRPDDRRPPRKFEGGPRNFNDRGPRPFGGGESRGPRRDDDRPPRPYAPRGDDRGPRNFDTRGPRRDDDRAPRPYGGGESRGPRRDDARAPRPYGGGDSRGPRNFDSRGPRRDDRAPRPYGDAPRSEGPRSDAPRAPAAYAKKPYGTGGSSFEKPFAKKAHHGEYRPTKKFAKDAPGPTMTGSAPYQQKDKEKKTPFWQKKFGKRDA